MLELPHTFRDWEEGSEFKCAMTVKMPNGAVMSFFGEGRSVSAARRIASFKADYKINDQNLLHLVGEDDDSSDTDEDDDLEEEEKRRLARGEDDGDESDEGPRRRGSEERREDEKHLKKVGEDPAVVEIVDSDEEEEAAVVPTSHQYQSDSSGQDVIFVDSDDDDDDETPLNVLQGQRQVEKDASPRMPFGNDTRDSQWEEPECEAIVPDPMVPKASKVLVQASPQCNGPVADPAASERNDRQGVASAFTIPGSFDRTVAPQRKSNVDILASLHVKRSSYIREPKVNGLPCGKGEIEARELNKRAPSTLGGGIDLTAFHEVGGEAKLISCRQPEGKVDEPAFREVEGALESKTPREVKSEAIVSRQLESRVDSALFAFQGAINAPTFREEDSDSELDALAFHEAKRTDDTAAHSQVERDGGEPTFREADTEFTAPVARGDYSDSDSNGDSDVEGPIFRESTPKSPPPLLFKSASEEPTYSGGRLGSESPTPPQVEEPETLPALKSVVKLPQEANNSSQDSDDSPEEVSRAPVRRRKPSKETKNVDSSDVEMYAPDGYSAPVWMQYPNRPPLRKHRQRPMQTTATKRRRLMDPQGRSTPIRRDRRIPFRKSISRSGSEVGKHASQTQATVPPHSAGNGPSPSSHRGSEDQEATGWNVVPKVKGSLGNGTVVPIPRAKAGKQTEETDKSILNGEKGFAVASHSATNGSDVGSRGQCAPRTSGRDRRNERNRNSFNRGRNARSLSTGMMHDANGHPISHIVPGLPGSHGLNGIPQNHGVNGMLGNHAMNDIPGAPGMTGMSGGPWFATPEALAQSHQLSQPRHVAPFQAPNMFLPVVTHNPYFPGPQAHPAVYGYGPAEASEVMEAQWEGWARNAAWKDVQRKPIRKYHTERRSRFRDSGAEQSSDSPPTEPTTIPARGKTSPETPTTVIEPGECSAGDEEDGEDHVSTLHVMAQKMRRCSNPDFHFAKIDGTGRWECTVKVKVLPSKPGSEPLSRTVSGRNRKKAKQKASKRLILALKEKLLPPKDQDSSENDSPTAGGIVALEKVTGISTAIGALNQLWHWKKLDTQPDARFEEIEGGRWRCTFILTLPDVGVVNVSEVATQKKLAKSLAGFKALERMRELKVVRPEEFAFVKPVKIVREEGETIGRDLVEGKLANEDIVQISDDEEGEVHTAEEDDSFDERLLLPKQYTLVIATSPEDCEAWRNANAKPGTELGIYVDSWSARRAFDEPESLPDAQSQKENDVLKQPVVCFSSKMSGLVLRGDRCQDEESRELDCVNGYWLPEAVRIMLKDDAVRKHGHGTDDGLMSLRQLHDIRVRALSDISISSFAVSALSHTEGTRVLWGLRELTKHWLRKEVASTSLKDIRKNQSGIREALAKHADDMMGTAILSAFACTCIQEQMKHAAARRRSQLQGRAAEFQELSKRLMHNPFAL